MNVQPPRKRLRFALKKLVADNMVAIYENDNQRVVWRRLTHTEHLNQLARKLQEEITETQAAIAAGESAKIAAEYGDVVEVLLAFGALQNLSQTWLLQHAFERQRCLPPPQIKRISLKAKKTALANQLADFIFTVFRNAWAFGVSYDEIEASRQKKKAKRGGYAGGVFVESLDILADDPWAPYYLADPVKHGYMGAVD